MKTSELIEFLKTNDVTKNQGYNLLIEDLEAATQITAGSIADPMPQTLIRFFMYQIEEVLLPVIADLRRQLKQVEHAGQVFKDELDATLTVYQRARLVLNMPVDGGLGSWDVYQAEHNATTDRDKAASVVLRAVYEGAYAPEAPASAYPKDFLRRLDG